MQQIKYNIITWKLKHLLPWDPATWAKERSVLFVGESYSHQPWVLLDPWSHLLWWGWFGWGLEWRWGWWRGRRLWRRCCNFFPASAARRLKRSRGTRCGWLWRLRWVEDVPWADLVKTVSIFFLVCLCKYWQNQRIKLFHLVVPWQWFGEYFTGRRGFRKS